MRNHNPPVGTKITCIRHKGDHMIAEAETTTRLYYLHATKGWRSNKRR